MFVRLSVYWCFISVVLFGVLMSISGNKVFMLWFGLELNMFGVVPFMLFGSKVSISMNKTEMKLSLYYFLVQVVGSLLFAWSVILGNFFGMMGLAMKVGIFPFFWWVPSLIQGVDWFSILLISTIQKIPPLFLLRQAFDMTFSLALVFCLFGIIFSLVGMFFKSSNLKGLMAWSSVGKMSLLFLLLCINSYLALLYFLVYSSMMLLVCLISLQKENKAKEGVSDMGDELKGMMNMGLMILVFSGLPPFLGFISKIYLFSSVSLEKCVEGLLNYYVIWLDISIFGGINLGVLLSAIMVLQSMGYMKFFIHLYSVRSYNLLMGSRGFKYCDFTYLPFAFLMLVSLLFLF